MKVFVYSILLTVLSFCSNPKKKDSAIDYSGFQEKKIVVAGLNEDYKQKDTLATLTINIPQRLDTFYQWQDFSDCKNCGYSKYRFSDRHYPQFSESGFFYSIQPDSTYQFNIWHKPFRDAPDTIDLKPLSEKILDTYAYYQTIAVSYDTNKINYRIKEFKVINGRLFIISAFYSNAGYLTWKPALFVIATTTLKSRELRFIAECSAKDTAGFIESMYKSILSIKVNER